MAIVGSILFKRTLKQFLDCDDLESPKGAALIEKLRESSKDSLERLIQVIPETTGRHAAVLQEICSENIEDETEEVFLKKLESDTTDIRSTAASILSQSAQINPTKLFKKLHESDTSKTDIIDILAFQREQLKPEQIITNAIKLDKSHAEQLLKLAEDSKKPLSDQALVKKMEELVNPTWVPPIPVPLFCETANPVWVLSKSITMSAPALSPRKFSSSV